MDHIAATLEGYLTPGFNPAHFPAKSPPRHRASRQPLGRLPPESAGKLTNSWIHLRAAASLTAPPRARKSSAIRYDPASLPLFRTFSHRQSPRIRGDTKALGEGPAPLLRGDPLLVIDPLSNWLSVSFGIEWEERGSQ
ncbi:hypothetical protein [Streptosporangium sandarakinum]